MVIIILVVLGLCFGSFVEATSWRIHEQAKTGKHNKKRQKELSITHGRSRCASCNHQLAWYDLLPVVSWVSLAGKCRYCRKPIGWQAPALEITTALLFVISYLYWPHQLSPLANDAWVVLIGWLVLLVGLILLAVYDLRWMLLPNRIVYPMQVLAAFYAVITALALGHGVNGLLNALLGALVIAGLFWVLFWRSRGAWIGGGDVRLAVVLGLIAGTPLKAGLVIFISSLLGSIVGVPVMVVGKQGRQTKVPFGPFLIASTVIIVLFGSAMLDWYMHQFLML